MFSREFSASFCTIMFLVSVAYAGARTSADTYRLVDLGTLSGGESSGVGINNLGDVVGSADVLPNGWQHGFFGGKPLMDVGAPADFPQSHLDAVSDYGQAIGWANNDFSDVDGLAYLWENHAWTPLGVLPGLENSRPTDINNAGQIVGWSYGGGYSRAWIWQDGELTPLPTPQYVSIAHAINESGTLIVGGVNADGVIGRLHAAVWSGDEVTLIGSLTGSHSSSVAVGVNDNGYVVGTKSSQVYNSVSGTAFIWDGDTMTFLPKPDGWGSAFARGINSRNQVVGDLFGPSSTFDGFIWENGVTRRLTDLLDPDSGWTILSAKGINDRGQIVGTAQYNGGDPHAVLLKPVVSRFEARHGRVVESAQGEEAVLEP